MTRGVKRGDGWSADVLRKRTYRRIRGVEEYELKFSYTEGGTYIDVGFRGHHAHDVINVWDYEANAPLIGSKREVKAQVNEYMSEQNAESLRTAWENRPRQ